MSLYYMNPGFRPCSDLYHDTTHAATTFSNTLNEQATNLGNTLDETLTSVQEKVGDVLEDIDTLIHRAMRPAPISVVDQSAQVISDHLQDGLTVVSRKMRDLGHFFRDM